MLKRPNAQSSFSSEFRDFHEVDNSNRKTNSNRKRLLVSGIFKNYSAAQNFGILSASHTQIVLSSRIIFCNLLKSPHDK